jgi:hypothetical protein
MANTPPTLSEWKAIILNPNGDFCDEFKRLIRMSALTYKWFSWAFSTDGQTPTPEFLAALTGSGIIPVTSAPGQVVGLAATGYAGYVHLGWATLAGASKYYIYRSATDVFADATLQGNVAGLAYADTTATPGTAYYYWVKAWNTVGYGPESASVNGSCTAGATATPTYTADADDVIVPAGMTKMTVYCWGGGGGGGYGDVAYLSSPWNVIGAPTNPVGATYGGGGGGGGYATAVDYTVSQDDIVSVIIGQGGGAGENGGESSVIYRGPVGAPVSIVVAAANGGNAGGLHTGGTGGIKTVGNSGNTGITGSPGTPGAAGAGGLVGLASGLESGSTWGKGGTGGSGSGGNLNVQPTPGQNGWVKIVFAA